jgi:small-conductance mechanosensitive channel
MNALHHARSVLVSALSALALAIGLLVAAVGAGQAQAPKAPKPAPPANLTQKQYDALVDTITQSVAEKLKADGITSPAKPPAAEGPDEFAAFFERASGDVRAIPALGRQFAIIPGLLDESEHGGRGSTAFLLLLGLVAIVAVSAEAVLRKLLDRLRARLAAGARPQQGLRSLAHLALLALLDGLGVFAVWLVCHAAVGLWFTGATGQDKLAVAVLTGIFSWRLYVLLFRILLQPDMPDARLCEVQDGDARAMYDGISAVMLLIILGRILYRVLSVIDTPPEAMAAYGAIAVLLYFAALVWLVVRSRAASRQWLVGLGTVAPLAGLIGRHWVGVGVVFFAILGGTQFYGAVTDRVHVAAAMLLTLNLVVGVLVFETLLQAFVRRVDSQLVGQTPASDTPKLPDVIARCVRVAVLIAVAVAISESWVVEVLGLVSEDEWTRFTRSSRTAGITLFLAFVAWELFKYKVDPYMDRKPTGAGGPLADGDGAVKSASRLSTLMPLLRIAMAIVIGVVALLVALDDFGINITPLIAGASVVGLAISFGSQTLVRDIVSGIFYLADDAFRVGEYIDCGKAKGTVEGFTLRSIRLRHQNGQVHTIPFGQLGQITNFSRDWITLKFNLRFARDTDLEKLRKAAKKIGTDMLEIPELKAETLAPFKMQGIADITDNALLVRFKFTAKPGNPASIQREAVKRMIRTFPELGIEFAKEGAAVILQTTGAPPEASSVNAVAEEAARSATQTAPAPAMPVPAV